MKVVGIIVEYNPFTKGHLYHLEKVKEMTKPDILIAVMSGNFVQRGEPAIISKEERVRLSLEYGIDLIIELPLIYAVESADYFAYGAISILNDLGVDTIVFGSETGDTASFMAKYEQSSIIQPHLDFLIKDYMDLGYSYPVSFSKALEQIDSFQLEEPNDILGFAYLTTINKLNLPMKIQTIKRDYAYKEKSLDVALPSASSIRIALKNKIDIKDKIPNYPLKEFHFLDDYFDTLKYLIIRSSIQDLQSIHLISEGVEYLLKKNILLASNMNEFINLCVSKRYTASRIKRMIIHLLLNTKKEDCSNLLNKKVPYIRILGFNEKGEKYISLIRKDVSTPILSRFKGKEFPLLNLERKATYLYYLNFPSLRDKKFEEELYIYPIKKV